MKYIKSTLKESCTLVLSWIGRQRVLRNRRVLKDVRINQTYRCEFMVSQKIDAIQVGLVIWQVYTQKTSPKSKTNFPFKTVYFLRFRWWKTSFHIEYDYNTCLHRTCTVYIYCIYSIHIYLYRVYIYFYNICLFILNAIKIYETHIHSIWYDSLR